ncbi:tripartite tricarboxylate transporter substrate binding protein [Pigmentiphaga sp. GD03639]|uniref:Bug family tripartite tricarboxylate transporter substrate binding protein n=1 Tax=Pigmentiphaga sp. GD03639 TaxID=2975354 RepID=UPI00244B9073|nr:tripartite tricarboxylate transporter substrate binding protein [Pigmentiphaga sp. GD03639]MDH2235038.1 tripartite tricarboxylate transporter substrate binding protein [Pigmentiphaga sp. GD03639]
MKIITRVNACLVMLIAGAAVVPSVVAASDYPNKIVKIVVPYSATGGGPDFVGRTVAEKLSSLTGQPFIIDNKPGAAATVGTAFVAKTAPDGYTILTGDTGPLSVAPGLRKNLSYDTLRDFMPVSNGVRAPIFIVVGGNKGINSLQDLAALAKSKPGLAYGTPGIGSVHHLAMEKWLSMAGVKMTHIPYNSQSQSIPAVVSGDVTALVIAYPNIRSFISAGRVKALAVGDKARVPFAPDVPTVAESGYPGYDVGIDVGFLVPKGTAPKVVTRLNELLHATLKSPEVAEKLSVAGLLPIPSTPEQFASSIKRDYEVFKSIIDANGITSD